MSAVALTSGLSVLLHWIKEDEFSTTDCSHLFFFSVSPPDGLSLWLVVWLVLGKPNPASACPHHCVCYPTPMTVSCQAQNFTAVPVGVPYESQRVFLQNNRITELRVGSFGFGTQVGGQKKKKVSKRVLIVFFPPAFKSEEKNSSRFLYVFL